jgi:hypothetical protein
MSLSCIKKLQRLEETRFLCLIFLAENKKDQMLLCEFFITLFEEKTHKNPICHSLDGTHPCLIPSFTEGKMQVPTDTLLSMCPPTLLSPVS